MCLRWLLASGLILVALSTVRSESPEPRPDVRMRTGFAVIDGGFESMGIDMDENGRLELTDIEAFFLICRSPLPADKPEPPNPNALRTRPAEFGKALEVKYLTERPGANFVVHITPHPAADGKNIKLTIAAPEGSTFVLKEPLEIEMEGRNMLILPAEKRLEARKRWSLTRLVKHSVHLPSENRMDADKDDYLYLVVQVDADEEAAPE